MGVVSCMCFRKDYVYTIDEKWGLTLYVYHEQANTLSHRDYKAPQAVLVRREERDDEDKEGSE